MVNHRSTKASTSNVKSWASHQHQMHQVWLQNEELRSRLMQLTQRQRAHALQHRGGAGAAWHMVTSEAAMQQPSARKWFLPMVDTPNDSKWQFPWGNYHDHWIIDDQKRNLVHAVPIRPISTLCSKTLPHFEIENSDVWNRAWASRQHKVRHESSLAWWLELCFSDKIWGYQFQIWPDRMVRLDMMQHPESSASTSRSFEGKVTCNTGVVRQVSIWRTARMTDAAASYSVFRFIQRQMPVPMASQRKCLVHELVRIVWTPKSFNKIG